MTDPSAFVVQAQAGGEGWPFAIISFLPSLDSICDTTRPHPLYPLGSLPPMYLLPTRISRPLDASHLSVDAQRRNSPCSSARVSLTDVWRTEAAKREFRGIVINRKRARKGKRGGSESLSRRESRQTSIQTRKRTRRGTGTNKRILRVDTVLEDGAGGGKTYDVKARVR